MKKLIQPVFIDYITNIGDKKVDETELKRAAIELKKLVADNTLQSKGV